MSGPENPGRPARTTATVKKTWWPGWIWAVPIAALGICAWLAVRELSRSGIDVTVTFENAANMKAKDTKVVYRGLDIGQVSDVSLAPDGSKIIARLDIDDSVERDLNTGTRFYLRGAAPNLADLSTLKSVVSGPTIEMVPGAGQPSRSFAGIGGEPPMPLRVAVSYLAHFDGDVGALKIGAPVTLDGFAVGEVESVRLSTDAKTGRISSPVVIALDPTRFNFGGDAHAEGDWSSFFNAALAKLVMRGLRARLTQSPPLIGAQQIALEIVPDAGAARLSTGGPYPEIPTVPGGGIDTTIAQLGKLPIAKIGDNVRAITDHVNALVSAPQLQDTLDHLDRSVTTLDRTLQTAGPQIAPTLQSLRRTVDSLRQTATEIDATAATVRSMAGGSPASPQGNLQQALNELSQAGRAVRSLADYLDQHPESLIKGR
jgi:paraquat-inducible protein B